ARERSWYRRPSWTTTGATTRRSLPSDSSRRERASGGRGAAGVTEATSRRGSGAFVLALAAAALVPAGGCLWRHLAPLPEDEILPLVPMFMVRKVRDALGGGFLAGCPRSIRGVPLPLTSYVIEGPLKAIPYAIAYPLTRWGYTPERLIAFYRA